MWGHASGAGPWGSRRVGSRVVCSVRHGLGRGPVVAAHRVEKPDVASVAARLAVRSALAGPDRGPVPPPCLAPPPGRHRSRVCSSPFALPSLTRPESNYLLAQARVDAPALSSSIAHLNTSSIFTPLQPLQDTDVAGFLRHAHEQNLISTIEEGRKETQDDFYRMLEDRAHRDWEAKKRRVFEELGGRVTADNRALAELKQSAHARSTLSVSYNIHFSSC